MLRSRIGLGQFLGLNLFFLLIIWSALWYLKRPLVNEGPQLQIYLSAKHLLAGGGLHQDFYDSYHEMIVKKSAENGSRIWQDIYSVDRHGQRIVKHPHLMIALVAPFLFLFGDPGILILGALSYLLLQASIYRLSENLIGSELSVLQALLLVCGTPFIFHATSISYDLLAATLIVGATQLARSRPLLAGIVMGLTVFFRPSNILYAPLFLFFIDRFFPRPKLPRVAIGLALAVAAFMCSNWLLWGGPLTPAHARMPYCDSGKTMFATGTMSFSLAILRSNLYEKFFSLRVGFLPPNLGLLPLLALPFIWKALQARKELALLLATAAIQIVLMFSYDGWAATSGGSRYLLPANAFLAIAATTAVAKLVRTEGQLLESKESSA